MVAIRSCNLFSGMVAAAFLALLASPVNCTAPAQQPATLAKVAASRSTLPPPAKPAQSAEVTEDELRQMLVGKSFYLRGGYLNDSLGFNEHGALIGNSPQGSYTLNLIEIDRVRMTRHKVEIEGVRYGIHFLGSLPGEDPSTAIDRVRITPKKKMVRITIEREQVVKAKKQKNGKTTQDAHVASGKTMQDAHAASGKTAAPTSADNLKAESAPTPAAEQPSDTASVTTTTSAADAARALREAISNIFAPTLDARMVAAMPDFWQRYYKSAAAKTGYQPDNSAVLRQSAVDRKAQLVSHLEADSNDYAQHAGVAGLALYHVVVGSDGKPAEIAVARPIGFGLDENAVAAIRHAKFEPAMKDGKPVPVLLDLVVEFRIYSKRTAAESADSATPEKPAEPSLPGPYSVSHPQ